ncbi:MAG: hypothetical protein C0508_11580 [Cyanobacteria bacterium PR.023]|jgi:hypothetical protein|nr:hypothetical protein [Cyanobacteria bacterium PR.023]MDQ5937277.1 hypothetical protein [Cyanobacteriota bacterium erpe_2018_sw_21hr_WHONDRS-SW48-000092_B_bin.40]
MRSKFLKISSTLVATLVVAGIAFSAPAESKNNDQQKALNAIAMQNYLNSQAQAGPPQNQYDLNISNLQKGGYLPAGNPNYNYGAYNNYGVNYRRQGHRRPYINPNYTNGNYNNGYYNNDYYRNANNSNLGQRIINKVRSW